MTQISAYLWSPTAFSVHSQTSEKFRRQFYSFTSSYQQNSVLYVWYLCVHLYLHVGKRGLRCQPDSLPFVLLCCPFGRPLATWRPLVRHRTVRRAGLSIREETVGTVGIAQKNLQKADNPKSLHFLHLIFSSHY